MVRDRLLALAPLVAAVLWGGMYVVSEWSFSEIPPVTLSFLRVALGAGVLLVIVQRTAPQRSFSRQEWRGFVVLGFWVTVTLVPQFVGTALTNASQGSLLTILTPIFTVLLGVSVLGEQLTRRRLTGMALAVAGTLLVLVGHYDFSTLGGGTLAGIGMLFIASFGWAAFTVWGAPFVRKYSALETATYATVAAVPMIGVLVPIELAFRDGGFSGLVLTPLLVGAVLYLGVASTAAAWYLWYTGLKYADAGAVAVFFFAQPVVGVALGALILNESIGVGFLVGGVAMVIGLYMVTTDRATSNPETRKRCISDQP
ncbi:MAG TPA: EamA family transporter [Halococcus sp.]|nr:EamA family transporter [Halococcus sp.]